MKMSKDLINRIELANRYNRNYPIDEILNKIKAQDKQLAELQSENERLAIINNQYGIQLEQKHNTQSNLQNLCNELHQQLKERDELIERLRQDHKDEMHQLYINRDAIAKQEERKQVCDKIRDMGAINHPYNPLINSYDEVLVIRVEYLDQIEKGE